MLANGGHNEADMFYQLDIEGVAARLAILSRLAAEGVTASDLSVLVRAFAEGEVASQGEIDALVAIEASAAPRCEGWTGFFIDTVTDHVVWGARPTGVVNEAQGEWLIAMADRCGTMGAFGALANVVAEAQRIPLWFLAAVRARAAKIAGASTLELAEVA